MSNYESPTVEVLFDKENFESYFDDLTLTDAQWESVQGDLEGRLWDAFETIITNTVADFKDGFYKDVK